MKCPPEARVPKGWSPVQQSSGDVGQCRHLEGSHLICGGFIHGGTPLHPSGGGGDCRAAAQLEGWSSGNSALLLAASFLSLPAAMS